MSRPTLVGALLLGGVLVAGCATFPPPHEEVANAELGLRKAEQMDAAHHAPLDMRIAREKLDDARRRMAEEQNLDARRLAEQALVDAQVAEAKASTARAEADAAQVRESIEALREEADRAGRRLQ